MSLLKDTINATIDYLNQTLASEDRIKSSNKEEAKNSSQLIYQKKFAAKMSNKYSHRFREAEKLNKSLFSKELTTQFNGTKWMGQDRQSQSKTNPYFFKAKIKTIQHQ